MRKVDLEGIEPSGAKVDSQAPGPLQAHKAKKPHGEDLAFSTVGLLHARIIRYHEQRVKGFNVVNVK